MLDHDLILLIGRVAKPCDPKVTDADIFLLSRNPDFKGDLQEEKTENLEIDVGGMKKKVSYKVTPTIKAKWIPLGNPNRVSSPALYGGETVLVFYNVKTGMYYYTTMFSDMDLKKTDAIEYFFSARKKDNDESTDERAGSYRLMIDTENKQVLFTTSKENEEYVLFKFLLDLLKGQYLIQTDLGDFINFIAKDKDEPEENPTKIHINLTGETVIKQTECDWRQIDKDRVHTVSGNTIEFIKGSTFNKIEGDANLEVKGKGSESYLGGYTLITDGTCGFKSKGDVILQTEGKAGITSLQSDVTIFGGGSLTLFSPTINLVGPAVSVTGALQAASISIGGGSSSSPQPMMIKADKVDWGKYDDGLKKLEEKVKVPTEDGDDGSKEEEKKEEKKEEEEEKKPSEVKTKSESKDAIISVEGKIELKSQTTAKIESVSGTTLDVGYCSVKSKQGVNIEGSGVTLYEILDGILNAMMKIDATLLKPTVVTGASVTGGPVTGTGMITHATIAPDITTLISKNTTLKGTQTFASRAITEDQLSELSAKLKLISRDKE